MSNTEEPIARDVIDTDILIVGAGIAGLSTAIRILDLAAKNPDTAPPQVLVLDKGRQPGAHVLSGAVINTEPLERLLGKEKMAAMPVCSHVEKETFCYLSSGGRIKLPMTPPPMKAKGYAIVSLAEVTVWLAGIAESMGAEIYGGMAAEDWVEEDGRPAGVLLKNQGVDKKGVRKPSFEAGAEVRAKTVVLAEGAHGILTRKLVLQKSLGLQSTEQAYALGIKELYEVPADVSHVGCIMHTFGYPLDYFTYGGGFVYGLDETHIAVGFVTALDYRDPDIDVHEMFTAYKCHPEVNKWITAGTPVEYGAKVLPEGGILAMPKLTAQGALIVGDAGGMLDAVRLKGAHLAVESGICAGETLFQAFKKDDWSEKALESYETALKQTSSYKNMAVFKHVRSWFDWGLLPGMVAVAAAFVTRGLLPPAKRKSSDAPLRAKQAAAEKRVYPSLSRRVEKDHKLDVMSDLYLSGTQHEEDQPCHLIIKDPGVCEECIAVYNAPCTRFCPADVYDLPEGTTRITIQPSNCLHCKTCMIKCTKNNIEWTLPEAGGGPRYKRM